MRRNRFLYKRAQEANESLQKKKSAKQIGARLDTIGSALVGNSDVFATLLTLGQVE